MKRILDFTAALGGLILLLPLMLGLGVAVALSSGFPVLFRQDRVGQYGLGFTLLKFRTMDAIQSAEKGTFDAGNTRRVTTIGRFLRRTKLDELPQLWNVVKGEMSLVGPRPEVRKWVEAYPKCWAVVHSVLPGITDPASIRFRDEEKILARSSDPERTYREEILPQKLSLYEEYVRTQSFWGDITIIFKTLWVVVHGQEQGAKCKAQAAKGKIV
ncbi:MAG: sugar transferase [Verrucomicrobia bacterium]|nr:sugar transferase [Verrucomicrobiota bacterium]